MSCDTSLGLINSPTVNGLPMSGDFWKKFSVAFSHFTTTIRASTVKDLFDTMMQAPPKAEVDAITTRFRSLSLGLGVLIGFLTQLTTLGAADVATLIAGKTEIGEGISMSRGDSLILALIWSMIPIAVILLVLVWIRGRFKEARCQQQPSLSSESYDGNLAGIEECFANGAMAGICLGWVAVSMILGISTSVVNSALSMTIVIAACWILMLATTTSTTSSVPASAIAVAAATAATTTATNSKLQTDVLTCDYVVLV